MMKTLFALSLALWMSTTPVPTTAAGVAEIPVPSLDSLFICTARAVPEAGLIAVEAAALIDGSQPSRITIAATPDCGELRTFAAVGSGPLCQIAGYIPAAGGEVYTLRFTLETGAGREVQLLLVQT